MGRRTRRQAQAGETLNPIPPEPPADPFKFTTIAHHDRVLLGPVSEAGVDDLLARVSPEATPHPPRVLDVGCGKGEMLLRAMERLNGSGVGVDPNPSFIAAARARAHRRVPTGALTLMQSRLEQVSLPAGQFALLVCAGATHAFGDFGAALQQAPRYLAPRGWALVGQGYWKRTPDPEYLVAFGGSAGELAPLEETLRQVHDAGWQRVALRESDTAEWDEYEESYAASVRRWLAARPNDADAGTFRERIETWHDAYRRWGRDTMGFALMLLRR